MFSHDAQLDQELRARSRLDHDLADTILRQEALAAVDELVRAHGYAVKRTQITGLRQVADNEPGLVKDFANHQRERAEKRNRTDEVAFWGTVLACAKKLEERIVASVPEGLILPKLPPGTSQTYEEKQTRQQIEARRKEYLHKRRLALYPAFFRHFCSHYLYRMAFTPDE